MNSKTQKITMLGVALFGSFAMLSAQMNSECPSNLSIFAEYAKVKNFDAAYEPWAKVRSNCPELNVATFKYGKKILSHKIENTSGAEKDAHIADLMKLYDEWLTYFPKSKRGVSEVGEILADKAQAMLDYNVGTKEEVFATFDSAFKQDAESFSYPKGLYNYFKTYYDLYKSENSSVTIEALFDKYEDVSEKFETENTKLAKKLDVILKKEENGLALTSRETRNKRVYEINSVANTTYANNLDAIIAKESSCENLIPLYRKNFEENKSNEKWLSRAAGRMDGKECTDDPLFVELVEALHELNPSANSAYYLGLLNDKNNNTSEALRYYEESLTLETDPYKKAKTLYKIAVKFKNRGQNSSARTYATKALSFQPSLGRAYLLIASLYSDSANNCGNSQFEKRAVYWLAAQTARKAGQVDASLKQAAAKTAASYEGRAPSKTDIFTEGMAGQTITFDCWIRASVKVPSL
jgi:tetratricopeptide (TPR) repeat protein